MSEARIPSFTVDELPLGRPVESLNDLDATVDGSVVVLVRDVDGRVEQRAYQRSRRWEELTSGPGRESWTSAELVAVALAREAAQIILVWDPAGDVHGRKVATAAELDRASDGDLVVTGDNTMFRRRMGAWFDDLDPFDWGTSSSQLLAFTSGGVRVIWQRPATKTGAHRA